MSDRPVEGSSAIKRIESGFVHVLFTSRWLMAPVYFGLVLAMVLLLVKFAKELFGLFSHIWTATGSELIIGVLSLVLAIQMISLGAVSLQNARYFNDAYYMGVELRRALERPQCGSPAEPE